MNAKPLLALLLLLVPFQAVASQEPNNCEWLLKYGIFDTEEVAYQRYTYELVKNLVTKSKAVTIEEFKKSHADISLNVPGIFEFQFGGKDASSDFKKWKEAFGKSTYSELMNNDNFKKTTKTISPALMKAVEKCLENKKGLIAYIRPSRDNLTFTLVLKYNQIGSETCRVKEVLFKDSKDQILGGSILIAKDGPQIHAGGTFFVFRRNSSDQGVTVVVNTNQGGASMDVAPVPPEVIKLEAKVELRFFRF